MTNQQLEYYKSKFRQIKTRKELVNWLTIISNITNDMEYWTITNEIPKELK